ncbi:hypothetical protein BCF33_1754 [Hasllibacter halocynthiae]|uniref:Uncharacterized protein n=1 Tax=Hasllibacter halocynthiae TaxID=595589 RepID=A0A2T0X1S8_9RHOB|nr:hypothetical protein [Hasllibacter halocynthiae]PRY92891.1 hypothetical protein BCF33_1754 [Hasllibacter halocynthiae]
MNQSATPPRAAACAGHRSEPLDALSFDAAERDVLTIARHYFRSFAMPGTQSWIGGIGAALAAFDHDRAPGLAVAAVAAVQAMRQARASTFRFNDPCCPDCARRITRHEKAWLGALAAMRERAHERASGHAVILCEGADHAAFLRAMAVLAGHLPPRGAAAPGRPAPFPGG